MQMSIELIYLQTEGRMKSLTFLDWDDTLLPTHYLNIFNYTLSTPLDENMRNILTNFSCTVASFIETVLDYSKVVIVTNSEKGWVELSAAKYLPQILSALSKCEIISARTKYEEDFPNDDTSDFDEIQIKRKQHTMKAYVDNFLKRKNRWCNIVSIGDSEYEREALTRVIKNTKLTYAKSVKLICKPTIRHLSAQLEYLTSNLKYVYELRRDIDWQINYFIIINNPETIPESKDKSLDILKTENNPETIPESEDKSLDILEAQNNSKIIPESEDKSLDILKTENNLEINFKPEDGFQLKEHSESLSEISCIKTIVDILNNI